MSVRQNRTASPPGQGLFREPGAGGEAGKRTHGPGQRACLALLAATALLALAAPAQAQTVELLGFWSATLTPQELGGGAALGGVGARMRAGLRASNRRARHRPMRYETGLPSSVIRFRTLHASTASRRCPDELRARRQSPTIDVYRKNAFSTRAC